METRYGLIVLFKVVSNYLQIRRCHSESDLAAQFTDRYACSVSPPPSSLPAFRGLASSQSFHLDTENKSPNISPASSPISDDYNKLRNWELMLAKKEDELSRVKLRAKEEAARAASLRHEEEGMSVVPTRFCIYTCMSQK